MINVKIFSFHLQQQAMFTLMTFHVVKSGVSFVNLVVTS